MSYPNDLTRPDPVSIRQLLSAPGCAFLAAVMWWNAGFIVPPALAALLAAIGLISVLFAVMTVYEVFDGR